MIFFSHYYRENKAIVDTYWLQSCFNFEEIIQRISNMVEELLIYNPLTINEAIKVLKRDNSQPLKDFNHDELRIYIPTK